MSRTSRLGSWSLSIAAVLLLAAAATADPGLETAGPRWRGADDRWLPFETHEEVLRFLAEAKVVSQKELSGGVNRPLKMRLEKDGVAANAIFRIVDVRHKRAKLDGKLVIDFHDSYIYECAAYELSRLLGIDNVPPCVKRKIERTEGTLQLWVENATTEKKRRGTGQEPPKILPWLRQKQTMRIFDAVAYNFDRNLGNMLIDEDWKLWFIDHTRSFRKSNRIDNIEKIIWCDRAVWERLQALDKRQLRPLRAYLTGFQIELTLERRDKVVNYLRERIDRMGEGAVIFDVSSGAIDLSDSELANLDLDDEIPLESSVLEEPEGR